MTTQAPYGSWPSPISPEMLTAGVASLQDVRVGAGATWWLEVRPEDGGRYQIVRRDADGSTADVLPDGYGGEDEGARVRRRLVLGGPRRGLLHQLGRPAPVPVGARGRPAGDHRRAGAGARAALRRRRLHARRAMGHLRPRIARRPERDRGAQRDRGDPGRRFGSGSKGPASRACSPRVATSSRRRASAATGGSWPGSRGTTRTCRGTTPSCGSATSTTTVRASWWWTEPGEKRVVPVSR